MPPPTRRDPLLPAEGPATNNSTMSATINSGSHMANTVESWVEIASQPSSSSLSSIADEIVITGLRVGSNATGVNGGAMPATAQQQPQRRRRLLQQVEQVEAAAGRPPTSHPTNAPSTPAAAAPAPRSSAGSSQEEYDETESEEDRVLSSSTEHLDMADGGRPSQSYSLMQYQAAQARLRQRAAASDGDDEDDDDDDGTALGILSSGPPTFRPQPNAFSHPPTHLQQHQQQPTASHRSVPTPHHMAAGGPYAPRSSRPARNSAPNFMSPSYREDNDAALRASLTTLLSCAAAARGLPKKENTGIGGFVVAGGGEPSSSTTNTGVRPSNQPMGLRLVPESELGDDNDNEAPVSPRTRTPFQPPRMPPQVSSNTPQATRPSASSSSAKQHAASSTTQQQQHQQQHHSSRNSAVSAVSTSSKSKRTGANKSSPRVTKKKRTASAAATEGDGVTMISPTLLTWVVSAGVVVLVSVVGFGAGFVIGREVGRQEAASSMSAAAGSSMSANSSGAASASTACGREIMRSSTGSTLRRFRWGGMTKSVAA